jgi:ribose transport system substrate-binding protein
MPVQQYGSPHLQVGKDVRSRSGYKKEKIPNGEDDMRYHMAWFMAAIAVAPFGASASAAESIAVFTKSRSNPVAKAVRAGAETAARAAGYIVFNYIPTSPDNVRQQTALVDGAIREKPAAIVFTPVDVKAMVPSAAKIVAAGIPVVNITDRLMGGPAIPFAGTDDFSVARETARTLLKAMGGKGNLVVLEGPPKIPTAAGRKRGFEAALKEFPNVKVILSKDAKYARPVASDLIKAMLKLTPAPQIDGVLAANDAMALGAYEALKAANKKALIVGINASREVIALIAKGEILASGDYTGLIDGCIGAEMAIRLAKKQPVPKEILARTSVVSKSNLAPFQTPVDKRPCPSFESIAGQP